MCQNFYFAPWVNQNMEKSTNTVQLECAVTSTQKLNFILRILGPDAENPLFNECNYKGLN